MKEHIRKLVDRKDLSQSETGEAFDAIMSGEATPAQIAGAETFAHEQCVVHHPCGGHIELRGQQRHLTRYDAHAVAPATESRDFPAL